MLRRRRDAHEALTVARRAHVNGGAREIEREETRTLATAMTPTSRVLLGDEVGVALSLYLSFRRARGEGKSAFLIKPLSFSLSLSLRLSVDTVAA